MDQQWEPVILRKTIVQPHTKSVHVPTEKDLADGVTKKTVHTESLQALQMARATLKMTQKQADTLCSFPANTFRDIESKRYVPNEKQQNVLQRIMGVQLKVITTKE